MDAICIHKSVKSWPSRVTRIGTFIIANDEEENFHMIRKRSSFYQMVP